MRNTRQRSAIVEVFETVKRPLTPQELLKEASKVVDLGIATVYRNINWLVGENKIVAVEFPGEPIRYEKAGKRHHHHFQCRQCQKVFEVKGCVSGLKRLTPTGFHLESHEILMYGLCADCNAKN